MGSLVGAVQVEMGEWEARDGVRRCCDVLMKTERSQLGWQVCDSVEPLTNLT